VSHGDLQDIIGQDEAIGRLQGILRSGRVPHALLFAGPSGVGRRTTALGLARILLCEDPHLPQNESGGAGPRGTKPPDPALFQLTLDESPDDASSDSGIRPCGQCEDCRMTAAGKHGDLHIIYKELAQYHEDAQVRSRVMQDLSISVIRDFLIVPAGRSPTRGRGKVFIVLEADLMSIPAQNALLKTLEEPPSGVTIILICERPEQLLPTTISRCSTIRFRLLPKQLVIEKLAERGIEMNEAQFWAEFTGGSIGRALRLSELGTYQIKRDLVEGLTKLPHTGDVGFAEYLRKTADALATKFLADGRKQGVELSKTLATRRSAGILLELIAEVYRDAMSVSAAADRPISNTDQSHAIKLLAERFDLIALSDIIETLARYQRELWRNVNTRILWDNVVLTCSCAKPVRISDSLLGH